MMPETALFLNAGGLPVAGKMAASDGVQAELVKEPVQHGVHGLRHYPKAPVVLGKHEAQLADLKISKFRVILFLVFFYSERSDDFAGLQQARSSVLYCKGPFMVYEALQQPCQEILTAIRFVLERTPPELAGDIMRSGIHLTGGGSLLCAMDRFIASELDMPVLLAKEPMECAVMGIGHLSENIDWLQRMTMSTPQREADA